MKKTLCSFLIIVILMNFIMGSVSYADGQSDGAADLPDSPYIFDGKDEAKKATPSDGVSEEIMTEGTVSVKNGSSTKVSTNSTMGGNSIIAAILGYLALIIDIIPMQIHLILSVMTITPTSEKIINPFFTLERIIFNKISLFNANYFNSLGEYSVGNSENKVIVQEDKINVELKKSVSKWFIITRLISLTISLFILIYIGIRMALSTIASDKAKYKKMLLAWVESIVILFILVYIMVLIINFGEILINFIYDIRVSTCGDSFEIGLLKGIIFAALQNAGSMVLAYSIMYWVLVYTYFKFFYLYVKRMLMVGFLIVIAPLITITYSIDKAGDGKAQAFNAWLSEFTINVLIQPLHALIYLVFVLTANEIAKYAPVIGMVFLLALGTVEKTVRRIFNAQGFASIGILNDFRKGKQ